MEPDLPALLRGVIAWGVMPLWTAAGFADWLCHRHNDIMGTSGWRESILHAAMVAQLGIPTALVALCEVNALVVVAMLVGFALHQLTVYVDLRYSSARRNIPPVEQMVHSVLEWAPALGGVLVLVLHREAVATLLPGGAPADWGLRLKAEPLPLPMLAGYGAAITAFTLVPIAAELLGCLRARTRTA